MSDFKNKEGSTGYLKDGAFVAYASQDEADASLKPAKAAKVEADADTPTKAAATTRGK